MSMARVKVVLKGKFLLWRSSAQNIYGLKMRACGKWGLKLAQKLMKNFVKRNKEREGIGLSK